MATVNLLPSSWLNMETLYSFQGVQFWGGVDFPEIPFDNADEYVQLDATYAKRVDLLSHDKYGDPGYWWAILAANALPNGDPILLPNQLIEGMTLRIPAKKTIVALLAVTQD